MLNSLAPVGLTNPKISKSEDLQLQSCFHHHHDHNDAVIVVELTVSYFLFYPHLKVNILILGFLRYIKG
jgi:hypothetical protein